MHGRACWAAAVLVVLIHCASGPSIQQDPTTERPKVGCILPTASQQARIAGRLLPETVLVIGVTSMEDGERWKVVRAPDFNHEEWEPHGREAIKFGSRCQVGSTLDQFSAARREP